MEPRYPRATPLGGFIPERLGDYLSNHYWDRRFQEEEEYEWCKDYSCFRHLLLPHLRPHQQVLVLGCGNSRMTESMCRDGIPHIISSDLSPVVLHRMRQRCAADARLSTIQWAVADMLRLPFADASFDTVVEKGTLDVLFVGNDSPWDPSPEVRHRVHTALAEVHRVLKPTGTLLSISFGQPHFRRPLFESPAFSWSMQYETFGDSFHYYFYYLKKGPHEEQIERREDPVAWKEEFHLAHDWMDDENLFLSACNLGED